MFLSSMSKATKWLMHILSLRDPFTLLHYMLPLKVQLGDARRRGALTSLATAAVRSGLSSPRLVFTIFIPRAPTSYSAS